ncbi:MAG TPA: archease [Longilinea sp.]|nr:archease [Longilinea sp.]
MEKLGSSGFRDVDHTADLALEVWAPDLSALFVQAALGMYHLMNIQLSKQPGFLHQFNLSAEDEESLLVKFLSEILFAVESKGIAFDSFSIKFAGLSLQLTAAAKHILNQTRTIKAVTFHNLSIRHEPGRYTVTIVFDV